MDLGYENKSVIITGGASGMGAALARLLAEGGANVVVADMNEATGSGLASEIGPRSRFVRVDVTDAEACHRLAASAIDAFGRIDVLFNNAGKGDLNNALSLSAAEWDQIIGVNLSGAFRVTQAVLPHLQAGGGGAIVNTCSVSGLAGDYGMIAYNTAKAGLINMTRCLALDHACDNIRVNAVCPGIIGDTAMTSELPNGPGGMPLWNAKIPAGRTGLAIEVARVMAFVGSDLASYMTGSVVVVDGGLLAHTGMPTPDDFAAAAAQG